MLRVRTVNASLVVRTDAFLSQFPAPTLFAESSVSKHGLQIRNADSAKRKRPTKPKWRKNTVFDKANPFIHSGTRPCGSLDCEPQGVKAGRALPILSNRSRWTDLHRNRQCSSFPYACFNTSSLVRQHARTHSTSTNVKNVTSKETRSHNQKVMVRTATQARLSQRRIRGTRRPKTLLTLGQRGSLLALRRKRALEVQRASLAKYLTRVPSHLGPSALMKRGHYRSLRRRLFNLRNWNITQLDLSRSDSVIPDSLALISAFAFLDRTVYRELGRYTKKGHIKHNQYCVRLSKKLFPSVKTQLARVQETWLGWGLQVRTAWFARLLFYLLDRKPDCALQFVQALATDPDLRDPAARFIADALEHLSKLRCRGKHAIRSTWNSHAEMNRKAIVPVFIYLLQNLFIEKHDILSQDVLMNLVHLSSLEDLRKLFDCLVNYQGKIKFETLLHYANAFSEAGDFQYALKSLDETKKRHPPDHWANVSQREKLRWSCALILRKSMSKSEDYHALPGIVAHIISLGVKMDILLYNVVMCNAMEAGDHKTAFKVFNTLELHGLNPDKITFSTLLYGCTLQADPALFNDFAQHCAEIAQEIGDPWLATDVLYYVYIGHQNDIEPRRSDLLWQTYLQFFSAAALKPFIGLHRQGLLDAIERQSSMATSTILEPTTIALYLMFQTEIKSALAIGNARVLTLYQQFRYFAFSPGLRQLARTLHIWNAFLHAFCLKQQFASASQVIKDMTDDGLPPNIYTWNIFMQAFFKNGQVQVAERVFEIARNRGVQPDQYSYGVLMRGYAKAQSIDRIGETMQHVDADHEMDPDLLRGLAKIVNRNQLMLALENSRAARKAREDREREERAEEERERWRMVGPLCEAPHSSPEPGLHEGQASTEGSRPTTIQTAQATTIKSEELSYMYQDATSTAHSASSSSPSMSEPLIPPLASSTQTQGQPQPADEHPSINLAPQPQAGHYRESPPQSSPPPPPPPVHVQRLSPNDPEVAYRKLQERLGILAPSTLVTEEAEKAEQRNGRSGGRGLMEFESMVPAGKTVGRR